MEYATFAAGVSFDRSGSGFYLAVSDDGLTAKIRRTKLSFSTASAFESCPARMAAEKVIGSDGHAAAIGGSAHTVLEKLYLLPAGKRSRQAASDILKKMQVGGSYSDDWTAQISQAYSGIFDIEDPNDIDLYKAEYEIENLTLYDIPITGFVDQIIRTDDGLRIRDFKSSAKVSQPFKGRDSNGDQLRVYAQAVRQLIGQPVADQADLLFCRDTVAKTRTVDSSTAAAARTMSAMAYTWRNLNAAYDSGQYHTKPGFLCSWCPLVNVCPSAQLDIREKFVDARELAPKAHQLPIKVSRQQFFVRKPKNGPERADSKAMTNNLAWRENKPWEGAWVGNYPSMASSAMMAIYGMQQLAAELLKEGGAQRTAQSISDMTATIGAIVDKALRPVVGHADLESGAHTRTRGVLRTAIDVVGPFPFGQSEIAIKRWMTAVITLTTELLEQGIKYAGSPAGYFDFAADKPWRKFAA